jgi:polar amino acid transport system substrate-binding protein
VKKGLLCSFVLFCLLLVSGSFAGAGMIFDEILKKNELVVGITGTQPPFNAVSKDGDIVGLDADIAKAVAMSMGVKIRFSRMQFSELLPALHAGKVDMIVSGMTMTPERNMKTAFIGPYYISGKGILLKLKNVELLKKEGVNSDKFKVTTLKGSTSQAIIEKAAPKAQLALADSYDDALNLLLQDKVDILIADLPYCAYLADRYSNKELVTGDTKLSFEPLGIAVREDTLLINALDNFFRMMVISGELTTIQERWLKSQAWIKQIP